MSIGDLSRAGSLLAGVWALIADTIRKVKIDKSIFFIGSNYGYKNIIKIFLSGICFLNQ
jgi:hypothetical protein